MKHSLFAAPTASPTSVVASEIASLKIRVVWGPVECIHRNGAITSYRVCHTNLGTLSEICAPSSGDGATSLDIPVSSAALYSVRVAAVNDVGEGPFSNEVQIEVVAPGELIQSILTKEVFSIFQCAILVNALKDIRVFKM